MNLIRYPESTVDGVKDEENSSADTDQWSSSPYMDQLANQVNPTDHSSQQFSLSRGRRVQANEGLAKMGRADLAGSVLDKLMKQGGYLDIVMYNTLINALGKAGRMDEVNKLFEQMRTSGINPDIVTFNTLIEVHSKAGRLKEAYKFLKMVLDAGCTPNHITDTTLDFLGKEIDKLSIIAHQHIPQWEKMCGLFLVVETSIRAIIHLVSRHLHQLFVSFFCYLFNEDQSKQIRGNRTDGAWGGNSDEDSIQVDVQTQRLDVEHSLIGLYKQVRWLLTMALRPREIWV
ncbi:hypothetical protein FEM48_Zijuj08G0029200 [Ziziphus jujuba var. spinosa]|uniref:Pentatricopeptide repeat-containing protein n=1 Tax=Ziziphus jujuba var. spinosa TaxID=714518 RepID=A0A978UWK7_ZIZJJ|nr:hypothetical protein FEM48_Zijuj08G0029200 [Ziziphus jujuba var. spinosa]